MHSSTVLNSIAAKFFTSFQLLQRELQQRTLQQGTVFRSFSLKFFLNFLVILMSILMTGRGGILNRRDSFFRTKIFTFVNATSLKGNGT